MGIFVQRFVSILLVAGLYILIGLRTALDLIGWSTAPDDVYVAVSRMDQILAWLMSTPWYVPWALALASTCLLLWVSWPRAQRLDQAPVTAGQLRETVSTTEKTKVVNQGPESAAGAQKVKPVLPPYEIERKLRAVDEFLDLIKGLDPILKQEERLPDSAYLGRYPDRLDDFKASLSAFVERLKKFQNELRAAREVYLQYDDIRKVTNPTFSAITRIEGFIAHFVVLADNLKPDVHKTTFLKLMGASIEDFYKAHKELSDWRSKVRGDLNDIRRELTT